MKKKIVATILLSTIVFSIAACGDSGQSTSTSVASTSSAKTDLNGSSAVAISDSESSANTDSTETPTPTEAIVEEPDYSNTPAKTIEKEFQTMIFEIPSTAEYSADDSTATITLNTTELILVQSTDISDIDSETLDLVNTYALSSAISAYEISNENYFDISVSGQTAKGATAIATVSDTPLSMSWVSLTDPSSTYNYVISYAVTSGTSENWDGTEYETFLNSIFFK